VAGRFYWSAFYFGDAGNRATDSSCVTEPLVVTPAPAQVATELSAPDGEISVGGTASDTATLTKTTASASGTVGYRFYGSLAACDADAATFPGTPPSGGTLVSTEPVTGGVVPPSAAQAFPATTIVYWAAFYSGDAGNLPAASRCTSEPLVVTAAPSQVTTELSAADSEIAAGDSASDTATLGGTTPTAGGTVVYRFYGSLAACDTDTAAFPGTPPSGGTLVSTATVTAAVVPPSAARTFPGAGIFYWAAFYSGDGSNRAAASDCASEPLVVRAAPVQVSTHLTAPGGVIEVDGSVTDFATLHDAGATAGGTAEYRLYASLATCEGDAAGYWCRRSRWPAGRCRRR
jgi:hypothetical protein